MFSMLRSTFQLMRGLGPERERRLWRDGVIAWDQLGQHAGRRESGLSAATVARLSEATTAAADALAAGRFDQLVGLLPSGEHWRLFAELGDDAAYLDIETGDDVIGFAGISANGILDRHGPALWLAGPDSMRSFGSFVDRARHWSMLVTFNGLSFDLPILREAFPDWRPPTCHVDLRHVLARLGLSGGLKAIERRLPSLHLARPPHLDGLGGWDSSSLFRRGRDGDRASLRRFAEYNLYDAVNLKTLMAHAYNALVEAACVEAPALRAATSPVVVPERGDVLYDVSKLLLAL